MRMLVQPEQRFSHSHTEKSFFSRGGRYIFRQIKEEPPLVAKERFSRLPKLKCPRREKEWYAHRPFSFRFGSRRPPLKMALRRPSHQIKSSAAALSQSSQCCRSRNHLRNYLISIAPELLTDRYLWVRAATTASENGYRKSAMICRQPSVRDGVSPKVRLYRREKSPYRKPCPSAAVFTDLLAL